MRAPRLLLVLALLAAGRAAAQPGDLPRRPELPRGADVNDWEAYFDLGVSLEPQMPARAEAAFAWAARLDPSRAEPLFALWAATHFRNIGRFERYLEDDEGVVSNPVLLRADSMRWRAFMRNPFLHRGLEVLLYQQLPGSWRGDAATRAWLAYGEGDLVRAADGFSRIAHRRPRDRYWAAVANASAGRFPQAAAHLDTILQAARAAEERRLVRADESTEMYEYALALLQRVRGNTRAAREGLERALVQNAAFYPARVQLGDLALQAGRYDDAVAELAMAVELAPEDGYLHFRHGVALVAAGRAAEAVEALVRAAELEPYFAEIDLHLGSALAHTGDLPAARAAYTRFLERAPRRDRALVERAQRWLDANRTQTQP